MSDLVRQAIEARLKADAPLVALLGSPSNVYHRRAPQQTKPPVVVFDKRTGIPAQHFTGKGYDSQTWAVRGFTFGRTADRAEDIDKAIDAALTDAPLTVGGKPVLAIYRESDIQFTEQVGKEMFEHRGGVYRVVVPT